MEHRLRQWKKDRKHLSLWRRYDVNYKVYFKPIRPDRAFWISKFPEGEGGWIQPPPITSIYKSYKHEIWFTVLNIGTIENHVSKLWCYYYYYYYSYYYYYYTSAEKWKSSKMAVTFDLNCFSIFWNSEKLVCYQYEKLSPEWHAKNDKYFLFWRFKCFDDVMISMLLSANLFDLRGVYLYYYD